MPTTLQKRLLAFYLLPSHLALVLFCFFISFKEGAPRMLQLTRDIPQFFYFLVSAVLHAYAAIYPRTDASGDVVRDFINQKPIYPCVVDAQDDRTIFS